MRIEFEIFGQPATQGSKRPQIVRRKGGAPVLDARSNPLIVVRDDNARTAAWRQQLSVAAWTGNDAELLTCPVRLRLVLAF